MTAADALAPARPCVAPDSGSRQSGIDARVSRKSGAALCQAYGVKSGYLHGLTTKWIWEQKGDPEIPATGAVLVVHANHHLESGKRIDDWYPDLPYQTPTPKVLHVNYHTETGQTPYVVGFTCQHGYMEKGGNLLPGIWARCFQEIERCIAPVRIVGAGADVELVRDVCEIFSPSLEPLLNRPTAEVLSVIAGAKGFYGAAAGLGIVAGYMGVPTMMGYPRWLSRMPGTWEDDKCKVVSTFLDELCTEGAISEFASITNGLPLAEGI